MKPAVVCLLAHLFASLLPAQVDLATLRGAATDASGAVVPNVKIVVSDIASNRTREATSTGNGDYEIPYLALGTYRLTATAQGFKTFVVSDILMRARELRRIDIALELGAVGSEVTVNGGAATIATEGSQITGGVGREAWVDSPLSQSFFPQAYMSTLANIQTQQGGFNLRFAGQNSNQVAENLDGVTSDGTVNLVQNMQDFEDLQVVAVGNSAEFSRVAQFSMAGKSGNNTFHGRVYYDLVNSALNARNTFLPRKIPYKEHRGGVNIHGPIIKNKLFFYGGYSIVRIPSQSFYNRDVPTLRYRSGDFGDLLTQARPTIVRDPLNAQPFPGNVIPAARHNPVSLKTQDQFIPKPNQGVPDSAFLNYGFLFPFPTDLYRWDSITARIDYNLSANHQVFGRFINRLTPYVLNGPFENLGTWTRKRDHHSIVINDTYTFSPRLVNSFHFGWIKDYFIDGDETGGVTPPRGDAAVAAIGLQGVNRQGFKAMGFPTMTINGFTQLRQQPGGVNLNRRDFEYTDSVTYSLSQHVLKFGGELRTFRDFNGGIPEGTYGTFTFNASLSGFGYSDFLLGLPFQSTRLDPITNRTQRAYELGLFITDTYKISRKLTLDAGIRWDYFRHSRFSDGLQYNWNRDSGDVVVPDAARARISPLYSPTIRVAAGKVFPSPLKTAFRPRIGLAYRVQDGFVVRGGYGVFTEALGNLHRAQGAGPFQIAETYFNQVANGAPLFAFPNPFPSTATGAQIPSQSVAGYPLDTRNGVIHQFNVSLEREVRKFGLRASYIGSRSTGLNYGIQLNKPPPSLTPFTNARRPWSQYVNAAFTLNDGKSKYDSGQIEVTRKVGSVYFNAHYTMSNNMSDFLNLENPYSHSFWNREQFNSRHRAVFNLSWTLPVGKGKRFMNSAPPAVNAVLGGWQAGWISYFQSGQYFTPSYAGADPSNTNSFGGIPDRIANGNLPAGDRKQGRWFDASAFIAPQAGRLGNSGVNILEGPGLNLHHLSLVKEIPMGEKWKFVLQTMATDIFNTPNFGFPNANITVPATVGRIPDSFGGQTGGREMAAQRQIQFRARIEF